MLKLFQYKKIDVDNLGTIFAYFEMPHEQFLQILRDQIDKENNSIKKNVQFVNFYVSKYSNEESDVDYSIKVLHSSGKDLYKLWESVDDGKRRFQLDELENFYTKIKETLEGIGRSIYDSQVRCRMSQINFNNAQKIYNKLKGAYKKVLKLVFLQKEIHLIDLKVFQNLVNGLDITDSKSEGEFKKYCNMIQGIQTMIGIEQDNQEFKAISDQNQGFFKLVDFFMHYHSLFKRTYEKPQEYLDKIGPEYSIDSMCDTIRDICGNDRSLQKSMNIILGFSQDFHKRCTEQIHKKAIEQNISAKNQQIDQLTIYKKDLYANIERFYLFMLESEKPYEIVGGIEGVYQSNKIEYTKFQDQIKSLLRKFKNQPINFEILDGYNIEAKQNILLTKYFIDLNNFLIRSAQTSQLTTSRNNSPQSTKNMNSSNNYDFTSQIESLRQFNIDSKIEANLKKRKNVNIEIYHRFETLSRHFYSFFDYAMECNKQRISFTQFFENYKKTIDLGDPQFIQNLNACLDLKNNFEKRIENYVTQMKATKLNSFFLFSKDIIEKLKRQVNESFQGINFSFLSKLSSLLQNEGYKECHMNYTTAYQDVKQHIVREQRKKQIKDFLDDLHSVYIPRVRMSLANSIINWQKFHQFIPEVQDSQMFEEMRFINQKFENHKHKNCEAFFASIYDIIHLYVQQKHNIREAKDLMNKVNDMFQKHNQSYQMNLQRDLSNYFQTIIKDDYVLSRNFKN